MTSLKSVISRLPIKVEAGVCPSSAVKVAAVLTSLASFRRSRRKEPTVGDTGLATNGSTAFWMAPLVLGGGGQLHSRKTRGVGVCGRGVRGGGGARGGAARAPQERPPAAAPPAGPPGHTGGSSTEPGAPIQSQGCGSPGNVAPKLQREYRRHGHQKQPLAQRPGPPRGLPAPRRSPSSPPPAGSASPSAPWGRGRLRTEGLPGPRTAGGGLGSAAEPPGPGPGARSHPRGGGRGAAAGPAPSRAKLLSGNRESGPEGTARWLSPRGSASRPPAVPPPRRGWGTAVDVRVRDECGRPCKSSWARALQ